MIKSLTAFTIAIAVATSSAVAQTAKEPASIITAPSPTPVPQPLPTQATPQPATPAAAPAATVAPAATAGPALVQFTGQLLDLRNNYVYFSTGDAFATVDPLALRIVDYMTGLPTTIAPKAKMFARATFDPTTKKVTELAITTNRLQTSRGLGPAGAFVAVKSTPLPAPEIVGQALTGKQVAVVFEITVPPTTSFRDEIYIATDSSGWNPEAIKLDRVDAYLYRAQRYFASGTKFAYRVTRGSWNSVERGQDNLDTPAHNFFVREVDSLAARVTVYHWSDDRGQNKSNGATPDSIPTPYNPSPFGAGNLRGIPGQIVRPTPPPGHP
jgi:hypothetical protein